MKRRMMWMAAMFVLVGGTAFGEKGSYVVNLPTFGEMGLAVDSLELQLTDYGFTATNLVTPAEGALSRSGLVDSIALKVNLKPGYKNAQFHYYTSTFGSQATPLTGLISNGSAVPFYTAQSLAGGTEQLITYVTNLTYEAMTFTLSFDACGGNVNPSYMTITYDQPYGNLPIPQREGCDFKGWWGEGQEWKGTETVRTLTNQTFTAKWDPIHYRVHFEPGEGGTGTMADQEFVYDQAQRLKSCAFTRANYVFDCWSNTVSGVTYRDNAEVESLTTNEVLTLVALWSPNVYSIHYHRNYNSDLYSTQVITYGVATTLALRIERSGYTFSGWARSSTAPTPDWGAGEMVSTLDFEFNEEGVFNLYAVWVPFAYTVQFFPNGGNGSMMDMLRTYDDGLKLPVCTFTNPGYTFAGWATTATGPIVWPGESSANLAGLRDGETVRLHAVWEPIRYSVSFAPNDEKATGVMASLPLSYGSAVKLPVCTFEKDGYEFIGWARATDGDVVFADGAEVINLTVTSGDDVVLFARWKAESYYVTLDANGGVFGVAETGPTTSNILVTVDEQYGGFPSVTNHTPKLVFDEWWTPSGDAVTNTNTVPPLSAGVTNLVAHWKKDDPLANAVDAEELDFDWSATNGSGQWGRVEDGTAVNGASAGATINSGVVDGTVLLTTKVVGPGQLTFNWRVLSVAEPWTSGTTANIWSKTAERLYFQLGATYQWGIAGNSSLFYRFSDFSADTPAAMDKQTGNPSWIEETLRINAQPGETNTLTWTFSYFLDDPTAGRAWVDNVRWVPDSSETKVEIPIDWNDDLNNLHSGDVEILSAADAEKLPAGAEIVLGEPPQGWKLDGALKKGADGSLFVTLALDENALMPQGVEGAAPLTIESAPDGKLLVKATLVNGVRGFWYSFFTADEPTGPWNAVTTGYESGEAVKQAVFDEATGEFSISIIIDPTETKRFYKLVVTEKDPKVVHLPSN
ncbi:MAG: InlB B-repeat-containing protein [Kiritimatiellae bacterium]|nr:InlB B-repeat-containing protein [Kiritimatiellia bacterium]